MWCFSLLACSWHIHCGGGVSQLHELPRWQEHERDWNDRRCGLCELYVPREGIAHAVLGPFRPLLAALQGAATPPPFVRNGVPLANGVALAEIVCGVVAMCAGPAGWYSSAGSYCMPCVTPGYMCLPGSPAATATPCDVGKYSSLTGNATVLTNCTTCAAGTVLEGTASGMRHTQVLRSTLDTVCE